MLAIRTSQLIDGTGNPAVTDAVVLVDDDRIVAAGPAADVDIPADAVEVDATRYTVIPGLIDVHVHIHSSGSRSQSNSFALAQMTQTQGTQALHAYRYAMDSIQMGYTALRSVASPAYVDVAVRNAINSGLLTGPRLRVSGQGLTITGGHMDSPMWSPDVSIAGRTGVCDGPWGCRRAAREQIKRGVDLIKVNAAVSRYSTDYTYTEPFHQEMTYDEMAAICEEAHWAGMKVAAHAHGGQGITDGIRAGLDSIEHAPWLTDEQIDMMVEKGVFYVPTLTVHTFLKRMGQEAVGMNDAAWNWLLRVCDDRWDTLARAHKAGVKIATGTDAGFFVEHGENAFELEDLVRGGFTAMEAIESGTRLAAECMGLEREIGTVEAGKYADLVIVDGDPLADVSILREADRIVQVYKGGKSVK